MTNIPVFFPRSILSQIKKYLDRPEIIAIKGPRQAGKTTILKHIVSYLSSIGIEADNLIFLTFEDKEILEKFILDHKQFIKSFMTSASQKYYFFLDEYQYVPDGGQKLKLLYDIYPQAKFIISGSSSLELTNQTSRYLVGRIFSFHLYPLSFKEFVTVKDKKLESTLLETSQNIQEFLYTGKEFDFNNKKVFVKDFQKLFEEYATYGGYPEVIKTNDLETKKEILKNIVNTYLEKDIIGLLQIGDFLKFKSLVVMLSAQVGNIFNYHQIGNDIGINFERLKQYLSILEETYVIKLLHPFYRNLTTELKKTPKNYYLDAGLRNYLISNFTSPGIRSDKGHLMEMVVMSNYLYSSINEEVSYRYWRTTGGAEVDLIIRKGDDVKPIEIKYSSFKKTDITRSLYSFITTYKPKNALVATKDFFGKTTINQTKIMFVPAFFI